MEPLTDHRVHLGPVQSLATLEPHLLVMAASILLNQDYHSAFYHLTAATAALYQLRSFHQRSFERPGVLTSLPNNQIHPTNILRYYTTMTIEGFNNWYSATVFRLDLNSRFPYRYETSLKDYPQLQKQLRQHPFYRNSFYEGYLNADSQGDVLKQVYLLSFAPRSQLDWTLVEPDWSLYPWSSPRSYDLMLLMDYWPELIASLQPFAGQVIPHLSQNALAVLLRDHPFRIEPILDLTTQHRLSGCLIADRARTVALIDSWQIEWFSLLRSSEVEDPELASLIARKIVAVTPADITTSCYCKPLGLAQFYPLT